MILDVSVKFGVMYDFGSLRYGVKGGLEHGSKNTKSSKVVWIASYFVGRSKKMTEG